MFKLTLSYDGTAYQGWQIQKNASTIQEVLEKAIEQIVCEKVRVHGSGRTDRGVHALGQVAHFRSKTRLPCQDLQRAVNSKLPADVRILRIEKVSHNFHAQYGAKGKIYRYQIWTGKILPVFERNFLLHHPGSLDLIQMRRAARLIIGKHDFSSFGVHRHHPEGFKDNPVKRMKKVSISKKGDRTTIELEANGFLYKMARSIVGTLLGVGEGKLTVAEFRKVVSGKNRSLAGQTALPQGLVLMKVKYR